MARVLSVLAGLAVALGGGVASAASGRPCAVRYDGAMAAPALVADRTFHARHGAVVTAHGGRVLSLPRGGGDRFLRFPGGACATAPCPQAIVRPLRSGGLVPDGGTGRFSFGADVRLTAEPPERAGMNVWQHGLAGPGHAQWKLQVDGGRPSCRWSDGTRVVLLGAGSYRLAVGRWYRLRCARLGTALFELRVLDAATREPVTPPARTVAPMGPIAPLGGATIGGKRVRADQADESTDQFHGDLDEVFFRGATTE
ncbi:hypothetical protein [Nonomuraea rhodomycinica]|uniref:Concanavalin A-like lectin/glucanases superfamily protein n=1 Tax=Nonomuraea rhodomycinica TaxID=1712872 RepID=A0A7Y6MEL8_9ACTN|nr:hypothetical protein [Nonomuraea rhodomycinica]NUW43846.1 hypothetical protein [Nonomuraea rhodomycinica]